MIQSFKNMLECFNADITSFEVHADDFLKIREVLVKSLQKDLKIKNIQKENPLEMQNHNFRKILAERINQWAVKWEGGLPMRKLSETFKDKIIFLIFGKVNSGKSSFCNFLVDIFNETDSRYFYFRDGKIETSPNGFKEGITETTDQIQGVELGNRLVLLDSPGLHSVTDKNAEITRCFTDSADVVIWITSSLSPGQVHELKDLKEEIHRQKPFLPVITKSDFIDEDEDEYSKIVTILKAKSSSRRKLQEEDVKKRAEEEFQREGYKENMKDPISISVQYYREYISDPAAIEDSGIGRLFESLAPIIDEARKYKTKKAGQQILNYMEGEVLQGIKTEIYPELEKFQNLISKQINEFSILKAQISADVISDVLLELPDLIEKFKSDKNTEGLGQAVREAVQQKVTIKVEDALRRYMKKINNELDEINGMDVGEFEDECINIEQVKGKGVQATASVGAAALGGAIGSFLGPVGFFIGTIIGGWLGNAGGEAFVETYTVRETVGVNSQQVQARAEQSIREVVPKLVEMVIDACVKDIRPVSEYIAYLQKSIQAFEQKVNELKGSLK